MKYLLLVSLLLAAAPVSAQSLPIGIYTAGVLSDYISTADLMHRGGHEADPLYAWGNPHPATIIIASAAVDVSAAMLWNKLTIHHRKLRAFGFIAAGAIRFSAAWHNAHTVGVRPWSCSSLTGICLHRNF